MMSKIRKCKGFVQANENKKLDVKRELNETKFSLEIEWWDQAIEEVIQDIQAAIPALTWNNLCEYVKTREIILGIEHTYDVLPEVLVADYIKQLIWNHHGDSFFTDGNSFGLQKATLHAQGLAIAELSQVIMKKLQEMIGLASDTQNPGGVLQDKEQLVDDVFCKSKNRRIKTFKQYVAESFLVVPKNYQELLQTCINAIKTQCGSLKWEDLLKVASANPTDIAKDTLVHSYMYKLIVDVIVGQGEYNVTLQDEDEGMAENEVVVQGTKAIADAITDKIFGRIKEGKDEKTK